MPFYNLEIDKESLGIREFGEVEKIVKSVLKECRKQNNLITIINDMDTTPPKEKLDPKDYFVFLCLEKGLNWAEIEQWLDYAYLHRKTEFYFCDGTTVHRNENKLYYAMPGTKTPSSLLRVF